MVAQMVELTGDHGLRDIADMLLEHQRVEYIHEGALTFVAMPGFSHLKIVRLLTKRFVSAHLLGESAVEWDVDAEHLQWEFRDGSRRFLVPDLAVSYPGAGSRHELQDSVVLVAEVTSPGCETVANDFEIKPKRCARNGVPFYLLVDQEKGEWTLHSLIAGRPRYDIHSTGSYGAPIDLPEPFGFSLPTDEWPPYTPEPREP